MAKNGYDDMFSSLISDIKSYSGKDPLLPWLRGIKKMKESLPPQTLNEKLPRFLQKCAQSFESDRKYQNDSRYIRVWLQLMDLVDDPKALLRNMEAKHIGTKRSLFYQAYALYYEKMKRYKEAEKMYHLGVQNLAEPLDELQKSYEHFLSRTERQKKKKMQRQELKAAKRPLSEKSLPFESNETKQNKENLEAVNSFKESNLAEVSENVYDNIPKRKLKIDRQLHQPRMAGNDDTVVVKFVDTAIVGTSEAEDACHHGLVDPTINMKEAMNAINNMFKEPIEAAPVCRRSRRGQNKENQGFGNGFEVFVDEHLENEKASREKAKAGSTNTRWPNQESFEIFIDDENCEETTEGNDEDCVMDQKAFVFLRPNDHSSESSEEQDPDSLPPRARFRDDTVVHRFVGSTISDEPVVENVCHHGLVDPTINLKEAMDDINNMFGKPIDFVRSKRSKRQEKPQERNQDPRGFSILQDDDDLEHVENQQPTQVSTNKSNENDLFEPTMCTKEAMDEINKLFGMPMDF